MFEQQLEGNERADSSVEFWKKFCIQKYYM